MILTNNERIMAGERICKEKFREVQGSISCNLCSSTLELAVRQIGPQWTYNLHVHPSHIIEARTLLRKMAAQYVDNPLSPYINLQADKDLPWWGSWYMTSETGDNAVGSKGV